jgi:hypothetical protein
MMFGRPEYSDETKCPKCTAALLKENARGYQPKPVSLATIRKYGLTQSRFHEMAAKQGGGCAICGRAPRGIAGLFVDHNHETGEVRGLLCSGCNTGLGGFGDDPDALTKAAAYLRRRGHYRDFARSRVVRPDSLSEVILDD